MKFQELKREAENRENWGALFGQSNGPQWPSAEKAPPSVGPNLREPNSYDKLEGRCLRLLLGLVGLAPSECCSAHSVYEGVLCGVHDANSGHAPNVSSITEAFIFLNKLEVKEDGTRTSTAVESFVVRTKAEATDGVNAAGRTALSFLERCKEKGNEFLERIVTADETMDAHSITEEAQEIQTNIGIQLTEFMEDNNITGLLRNPCLKWKKFGKIQAVVAIFFGLVNQGTAIYAAKKTGRTTTAGFIPMALSFVIAFFFATRRTPHTTSQGEQTLKPTRMKLKRFFTASQGAGRSRGTGEVAYLTIEDCSRALALKQLQGHRSIMQCLKNTPLADYFCSRGYDEDVTQGKVAKEVATVMLKLRSGELESTNCQDLKRDVDFLRNNFRGSEHQDSHEFLVVLMDLLHEDLGLQSEVKFGIAANIIGICLHWIKSMPDFFPSKISLEPFRAQECDD
ncbi:Ubiquitin carboxyl-terminal hydrolase 8 [Zootermopsis nevadensis]|uniref:Ubiquitin carboxyl-terminal hydrolase 8 n=1 Tax=Zootermopsis nevadensis TaxID=136037 RepID=A0A067QGH8_ZOONE|nr:Ubiquitin carboxyl-terminal hydrolase 8 [Zootermopsis nevadensis]